MYIVIYLWLHPTWKEWVIKPDRLNNTHEVDRSHVQIFQSESHKIYIYSRSWFSITFSEKQEFITKTNGVMEIFRFSYSLQTHLHKMETPLHWKNPSSRKLCPISGRHSLQGCPVPFISDVGVKNLSQRKKEKTYMTKDREKTQCVFRSTEWKWHHLVSNKVTRIVITANILTSLPATRLKKSIIFRTDFERHLIRLFGNPHQKSNFRANPQQDTFDSIEKIKESKHALFFSNLPPSWLEKVHVTFPEQTDET